MQPSRSPSKCEHICHSLDCMAQIRTASKVAISFKQGHVQLRLQAQQAGRVGATEATSLACLPISLRCISPAISVISRAAPLPSPALLAQKSVDVPQTPGCEGRDGVLQHARSWRRAMSVHSGASIRQRAEVSAAAVCRRHTSRQLDLLAGRHELMPSHYHLSFRVSSAERHSTATI